MKYVTCHYNKNYNKKIPLVTFSVYTSCRPLLRQYMGETVYIIETDRRINDDDSLSDSREVNYVMDVLMVERSHHYFMITNHKNIPIKCLIILQIKAMHACMLVWYIVV